MISEIDPFVNLSYNEVTSFLLVDFTTNENKRTSLLWI